LQQEVPLLVDIPELPPRAPFEPRKRWLARVFGTGVTVLTAVIAVLAVAAATVAIGIS
jgi:hypothetical protein